jgi:hypothetical protein
MKVLIILLLLVILIYFIYLKKEHFSELEITPEMRARMNQEQIDRLNDTGSRTMTHTAYMEFETKSNLQRFNDLMGDYQNKFNFAQNYQNGLGLKVRPDILPHLFNSRDGNKKYRHFLGFKDSTISVEGLETEYANPNNYDYSTLFVEKFQPNVTLTTLFEEKETPIRLRYEIMRGTDVIFSNYIFYENQAVDDISDNRIKLIKSPMSKRYEPYGDILLSGSNFSNFIEDEKKRSFGNYFKDLHRMIIDLKNCTTNQEYQNLNQKYKEGEYKYAFEDFDRIEMNMPTMFSGEYNRLKKEATNLAVENISEDSPGVYKLIFNEKCREIKTNLYLPPGDDYKLTLVCESTSPRVDNDILISLDYNFSLTSSPLEKVILQPTGEPISFLNFNQPSSKPNSELNYYLKLNTEQYKEEFSKIEYITKNPNKDDTQNPFLVRDNVDPLEPGRYYKYVNIILFKVLLKLKKNMKEEIYSDNEKTKYLELSDQLDFFLSNYLSERSDDRVLKNPSNRYKRLDAEIERLSELPLTEENVALSGFKTKELDRMRIIELNEKQPLGPYQEKIDNLDTIYKQIINDSNNDTMKEFLKTKLGVSENPTFESLIEKYLAKHLLEDINQSLNATKTKECITIFKGLLNTYQPDDEGIISNTQRSTEHLNVNFSNCYHKTYPFKIEIKEEPEPQEVDIPEDEEAIDLPEPPPEVSRYTEIMREVIGLVKRDFRKIVKMRRYDSLDPELEKYLKSIKKASDTGKIEEKPRIKKMIKLIINLIDRIKDGSIDDINDLIELNVDKYDYPNEVLVENFSNINIMRPLRESFIGDVDLHKHTSEGKINFGLDWGNPLEKPNQGRYDEYGLLSDESKKNVLNSYNKVNQVLTKANSMVNNFANQMGEKVNNVDYDKIDKETNKSIEQIEKTQEGMEKLYLDTETKQNEKIARITEKVQELEKLQNKKYIQDSDSYNSIKSFGDGQVISVQNMKKDIYSILVNKQCLQYGKKGNLSLGECDNNKSQQFKLNMVKDMKSYNNLVVANGSEPVSEYDSVSYPFNTINPILHKSQCLTLNGNSIGVNECININRQRWEGLKNIKLCDNFNMN